MNAFINSPFFGISLSILIYWLGASVQARTKSVLCNPLLISIVVIVTLLSTLGIPYESFNQGGSIINMFLAPATACLAVSIYSKIEILKKHWLPILIGCSVGSLTSMISVYLLCRLFGLDEVMISSLLPKSVSTPMAVEICNSFGGIPPVTVIAVLFSGLLGYFMAPLLIRIFRVEDSMTAGLAIGASSHAIGTSRAVQIGETEGAMSGLAIGICGVITMIFSSFLI